MGLLTLFAFYILQLLKANTFAAQRVLVFIQLSIRNGDIRCVLCVLNSHPVKITFRNCLPKPNQTSLDAVSFKDHFKNGKIRVV